MPIYSVAQNLVYNGSFEEHTDCPIDTSPATFPALGWYVGWLTPDYFNTCADSESNVSIPDNWFGYQQPYNGNAYSGVFTFLYGGGREYLQGTLLSPLIIGTKYYVSLKVSLSDYSATAASKMGVLFTTYQRQGNYLGNFAHVYTNTIISDSVNWVTINGCFEADSAYSHITLGNFFDDDHTDFTYFPKNPNPSTFNVRYYIDDVRVSTDSVYAGGSCKSTFSDVNYIDLVKTSVFIYPNPATDYLTIDMRTQGINSIQVYDITGRLINTSNTDYSSIHTLDISDLSKGIYLLRINSNSLIINHKFYKQ